MKGLKVPFFTLLTVLSMRCSTYHMDSEPSGLIENGDSLLK